jgi:cytochrome c oxidase assembly protein subunit 15
MQNAKLKIGTSPWPHRWAVALACATFPLLWVGGLVTTTGAGMAVPDWPTTYGYNLFLYPWATWLAGPWDLFVEHGHRLLGAVVGLITIGLLAAVWRTDERRWMRRLGMAALALVIFQGVLGGMRVRLDERTLAMLHGCTGPLFFGLTIAMVVFTSTRWCSGHAALSIAPVGHIRRLALVTCILVYLQILLGAVVRHVPVAAEPTTFVHAVRFHLFLAAILTLHIAFLCWSVWRHVRGIQPLRGLAFALAVLLLVQLTLGAATWLVKFAAPSWAPGWISIGRAAIQDGGWLQTHVITAHVAVGSLLLATSLALALYIQRLLRGTDNPVRPADGHDCPSYTAHGTMSHHLKPAL